MPINPELRQKIRTVLLECSPIHSEAQMRDLFVDPRISPWRYSLPGRDNVISRAEAYIALLAGKQRADDGQNALLLLLRVLSEQVDEGDANAQRLTAVADELQASLTGSTPPTAMKPITPTPNKPVRYNDTYTRYEIGLERLEQALGVNHPEYLNFTTQQTMLQEQIDQARKTGSTEDRAVHRAEIIARLNHLALTTLGKSFNSLCS